MAEVAGCQPGVDRTCTARRWHRWWRSGRHDRLLLRTLLAAEWRYVGRNDRPYPLLSLRDSQSFANAITDTFTDTITEHYPVAFALQERESYPFAARLISRTNFANLR